jgi:hypothetical protein
MESFRLFTTDPETIRTTSGLYVQPSIVRVPRLDVPPPALVAQLKEWPPVWVGVAADLERLAPGSDPSSPARLAFALQGLTLLAQPEFGDAVQAVRTRGFGVDLVVYLDKYGGER